MRLARAAAPVRPEAAAAHAAPRRTPAGGARSGGRNVAARTSVTDPIEVAWLSGRSPRSPEAAARVGLTLAPGKRDPHAATGAWERDLDADLRRLRDDFACGLLVPLLEDRELAALGIERLVPAAEALGCGVVRLPIADGGTPPVPAEAASAVARIVEAASGGTRAVVHCKGGLGRAGTIGACVLVALGEPPDEAIASVRAARPGAIENAEQERFVCGFEALWARRSRALGCVLGAAVGDAMGHPTEFLSLEEIRRDYPPDGVTGYELYWERDGQRFAPYTDDTQMAEIVLRALVRGRQEGWGLDATMEEMARGFAGWESNPQDGHRAPGNACLAGARALARGAHWSEAGGADAGGCGSVMRSYPFGLVFADDPDRAEEWAARHSALTHRAPIALAACAAMARATALAIAGEPHGAVLASLSEAAARHDERTAAMIRDAIADAARGEPPERVLVRLDGWAAHEAIAAAAYVVARHPDDPRAAILEGANAPGDSDSIATLAGALLGARRGLGALPAPWVGEVERSRELLALGEAAFAAPA